MVSKQMVHLAASKPGNSQRCLRIGLDADFYQIQQVTEASAFLQRLNEALVDFLDNIPNSKDRNGRTRAYVTLCTPSYLFGLIGLSRSLSNHSSVPLICLVDIDFEFDNLLDLHNVHFVRIPRLINSRYQPWRREFSNVMSKLWVFGLSAFDHIVFLDSDVCVISNIDELYEYPSPSFAPDYINNVRTQRFNSGVFVVSPDKAQFEALLKSSAGTHSYDGGDQGLLNHFFSGTHRWLPHKYNVTRHHAYYGKDVLLQSEDIAILHYIVKKPWEFKYRELCDAFLIELEDRWTENLTKNDLLKLIKCWRKEVFVLYERDKIAFESKRIRHMFRRLQDIIIGFYFGLLVLFLVIAFGLFGR